MTAIAHPPKPNISVKAILKRRDKLVSGLAEFLGKYLVADDFHAFVDRMHLLLPDNILRDTVYNSLKSVLKKTLTPELLKETCWRLAGNVERLSEQKAVTQWFAQVEFEWVAAKIIKVRPVKRFKLIETELTFRIMSGTPVTHTVVQCWSNKKAHYLAKYRDLAGYGFGFGKHKLNKRGEQLGRMIFTDTRQFYGLHCLLLIDPDLSKDAPVSSEIGHSGSTMAHNRSLLKGRDRLQFPCIKALKAQKKNQPTKLSLTQECVSCPFGAKDCSFATHAATYTVRMCTACGKKAFFDPLEVQYKDFCISCAQQERLK